MTLVGSVDLIVLAIGLIIWFIPFKPPNGAKLNELGKLMFFCGLLAELLSQGSHIAKLGS